MKTVAPLAILLGLGAVLLGWLQHSFWVGLVPGEVYVALVAAGAVALGIWLGRALLPGARSPAPGFNHAAARALGLSPRELQVLAELASGDSNKVLARRLGISPHTVKTHIARICEKLEVERRGQAVEKARLLELIP